MQINMTLFLQVLNFWVTYWFLNKFMFKTVLLVLDQKKQKEDLIKKKISQKEKLLLQMERSSKKELDDFKTSMSVKYEVEMPVLECAVNEISDEKINKNESEKIIQAATELLVERVPHVD